MFDLKFYIRERAHAQQPKPDPPQKTTTRQLPENN